MRLRSGSRKPWATFRLSGSPLIRKNDMLTDVLGLMIQIKQGAPKTVAV